jgi:tripartite-type tricarboxylate transporter receptor subunit TctC
MFVDQAGVKAKHIPYKGVGPMLTDLLGGQIDFATSSLPSGQQRIERGALRALGVGATDRDAGYPDDGRAANAELSRRRLVRDHRSGEAAGSRRETHQCRRRYHVRSPEVKDAMAKQGNTIVVSTPGHAGLFIGSEMTKYAAIVKKTGLEPQ